MEATLIKSVSCVDCGDVREEIVTRGRTSARCQPCRTAHSKATTAARCVEWRATNPARNAENKRAWAMANPERYAESSRRWYEANTEREAERKKALHAAHPILDNERARKWKIANPGKVRVHTQCRRALKAGAPGSFTADEFTALCEAYDYRCVYCGREEKLTADHAVPLGRGGSNWIANILPACRSCNSRKRNRTAEEFLALKAAA